MRQTSLKNLQELSFNAPSKAEGSRQELEQRGEIRIELRGRSYRSELGTEREIKGELPGRSHRGELETGEEVVPELG